MTNKIDGPIAKAQLLIRKPVRQVFEALVDPAITSRFWFSKGSGRLETGKRIRWDWEMYGVHADVEVKAIETNKRILIEWNGPGIPCGVSRKAFGLCLGNEQCLKRLYLWGRGT